MMTYRMNVNCDQRSILHLQLVSNSRIPHANLTDHCTGKAGVYRCQRVYYTQLRL